MPPAKPPPNSFAQKALTVIFAGAVVAMLGGLGSFFYWLAGSTMDIQIRTTRIEERAARIEEKVGSLLSSRADQAEEQASSNTRRLDDLEQGAGE